MIRQHGMALWREQPTLVASCAMRAAADFRLPPEHVVELGVVER